MFTMFLLSCVDFWQVVPRFCHHKNNISFRHNSYVTHLCLFYGAFSNGRERTQSLHALTPSQRAATLHLSSPTEHQSNYYDVLHGDDSTLRSSYERPTTSAAACCDVGDYLTPSDAWTTATLDRQPSDACCQYQGLCDSGKYLQLQGSVYYEYI